MEKIKQYKRHLNISGSNMKSQNPTTKITFELDDKEMSLIGDSERISVNTELTLELNKRLHQNKDISINRTNKQKDKRYRFVVLDTSLGGYGIDPKHLNIESNYNTIYDYDKQQVKKIDEDWWFEENKTDDYNKDFKELELDEREVK